MRLRSGIERLGGKPHLGPEARGVEADRDLSAEPVGQQGFDQRRAEPAAGGRDHRRAARLGPEDARRAGVRVRLPPDRYDPARGAERAVFRRVRREFVQDEAERVGRLGAKAQAGAAVGQLPLAAHVGFDLREDQLAQADLAPGLLGDEIVRPRHRVEPPRQRLDEGPPVPGVTRRLLGDGLDRGQHVLHAMLELEQEEFPVLLVGLLPRAVEKEAHKFPPPRAEEAGRGERRHLAPVLALQRDLDRAERSVRQEPPPGAGDFDREVPSPVDRALAQILGRSAQHVEEGAVRLGHATVDMGDGDADLRGGQDRVEAVETGAQRLLGVLAVRDLDAGGHDLHHGAGRVALRDQREVDPDAAVVGHTHLDVVALGLSGGGTGDGRLQALLRGGREVPPEAVPEFPADHILARDPGRLDGLAIRLGQGAVGVEPADEGDHAVEDAAHVVGAGGQGDLGRARLGHVGDEQGGGHDLPPLVEDGRPGFGPGAPDAGLRRRLSGEVEGADRLAGGGEGFHEPLRLCGEFRQDVGDFPAHVVLGRHAVHRGEGGVDPDEGHVPSDQPDTDRVRGVERPDLRRERGNLSIGLSRALGTGEQRTCAFRHSGPFLSRRQS